MNLCKWGKRTKKIRGCIRPSLYAGNKQNYISSVTLVVELLRGNWVDIQCSIFTITLHILLYILRSSQISNSKNMREIFSNFCGLLRKPQLYWSDFGLSWFSRYLNLALGKLHNFRYRIVASTNTCYYSENQLFV